MRLHLTLPLIAFMASPASAQTLGEISQPLPWRVLTAEPSQGADATWTGREPADVEALVRSMERGLSRIKTQFPADLFRRQGLSLLSQARANGLTSAQGRELAAYGMWRLGTGIWIHAGVSEGDPLDGEDVVKMAETLDVPIAQTWGRTKQDFRYAIMRYQSEQ